MRKYDGTHDPEAIYHISRLYTNISRRNFCQSVDRRTIVACAFYLFPRVARGRYQELCVFFAPQDNNKYRIRCFLAQSLSFPARRRKGGKALHARPLAGKFVPEHTDTSYRLLNAGSTFYPYLIRLSVKRERCAIEYYSLPAPHIFHMKANLQFRGTIQKKTAPLLIFYFARQVTVITNTQTIVVQW